MQAELLKIQRQDKVYGVGETRYDLMIKDVLNYVENSIPKQVIEEKIKELKTYRDLANELIEERVIIADSDSLQYGRKEAHDKDIDILQELLEGK